MKLDRKTAQAIGNLAVRFWAHVFRRTFAKPKPGEELKIFRENYAEDLLAPMDSGDRAALPGYEKCVNCGACSSVCPVCGPVADGIYRGPESIAAALTRGFPDFGDSRDSIFNCVQCGACADVCPRGVNVPELVLFARRKTLQMKDSFATDIYGDKINNLIEHGNIYGAKMTGEFDRYKKGRASIVYFIGCAGKAGAKDATMRTLMLLEAMGTDFTTIGEQCCGGFHRNSGLGVSKNPGAPENISSIGATGAKMVVAGCPHCMDAMKNHEPYKKEFAELGIEVLHLTEYLSRHMPDVKTGGPKTVWHDPCFLGRRGGIFDEPRELIALLGGAAIEMSECREGSRCCGSMDGTSIIDGRLSEALAAERIRSAEATGAELLLTECPSCLMAFRDSKGRRIEVDTLSGRLYSMLKPRRHAETKKEPEQHEDTETN